MPEDTRKPVVEGAIHAERDPNPKHRGGVIFTMSDGSKVTVYDSGGQVFAFRTLNPGIKSSNAPGIIGTYVKKLKDKKGKLHDYNYPIFGSVKDAKGAALKEIEDINRRRGGDLSIEDVLGGDDAYNEGKGYYRQAIQPQISRLAGNPVAPDPSTKWSSLSPEQKDQIGEVILRQEGVYNSRGSTVIRSEKHSDATPTESLLPKSPIQTAASKSSDRLRLLYDAFVAQDGDLNTLDHLAGFYPGSTTLADWSDGAAHQGSVDAFVRAVTEFVQRTPNLERMTFDSSGLAAGISTVNARKDEILTFLASREGQSWITSPPGGANKSVPANVVPSDLRTAIGQQILRDPEMFSLAGEALNNTGHIAELGKLPETGSPQFRQNKPTDQFPLTEGEHLNGPGADRLREMLQHVGVQKTSIVDLNKFGATDDDQPERLRKSSDADSDRIMRDLFEHQRLPSPPEKALNRDPDFVAEPTDDLPAQPHAQRASELPQWPLGRGDLRKIDINDPSGAAPGAFDVTAAKLPDIAVDPQSSRELASLVFPPQGSRYGSGMSDRASEFRYPSTSSHLFGDDTDRAGDDFWDGSYLSSLPPPLQPKTDVAETPRPDYDRITREVMRRIADEGNRPPRGILFDPSATVPFMAS